MPDEPPVLSPASPPLPLPLPLAPAPVRASPLEPALPELPPDEPALPAEPAAPPVMIGVGVGLPLSDEHAELAARAAPMLAYKPSMRAENIRLRCAVLISMPRKS